MAKDNLGRCRATIENLRMIEVTIKNMVNLYKEGLLKRSDAERKLKEANLSDEKIDELLGK